jgi:hypothetical protein
LGPVTVYLSGDTSGDLRSSFESFGVHCVEHADLSRSFSRHELFLVSPYETTLVFDSDLLFQGPIEELFVRSEREGVLVTRFHPAPYGVDGTPPKPGFGSRTQLLDNIRPLLDAPTFERAVGRLLNERVDVNVGVMGIARPRGDDFLREWADLMERGRGEAIPLLDEMLVVALITRHQHFLANEDWNCPADLYFRRTDPRAASVIHFFADGQRIGHNRLGRSRGTYAGRQWYAAYSELARQLDLSPWRKADPLFETRLQGLKSHPVTDAARRALKRTERMAWRPLKRLLRRG